MNFEVESLRQGYAEIGQTILMKGTEVSPRGEKTLEILGVSLTVRDPIDTLPVGTGRGVVKALAATETLQLIGGFHDPITLVKAAPHFAAYLGPDGHQRAPYGPRLVSQIPAAIQRLKDDPDTRQAQVAVWQPQLDLASDLHDYPCTTCLQWFIRDGKLHMQVHMRSNDFWLGLPYDAFQFTQLQLAIASYLGLEPGAYRHSAASLHIYEKHFDQVAGLTAPTGDPLPTFGLNGFEPSWLECTYRAIALHQGILPYKSSVGERWLHMAMAHVNS